MAIPSGEISSVDGSYDRGHWYGGNATGEPALNICPLLGVELDVALPCCIKTRTSENLTVLF